jgi:hypothetical protein
MSPVSLCAGVLAFSLSTGEGLAQLLVLLSKFILKFSASANNRCCRRQWRCLSKNKKGVTMLG